MECEVYDHCPSRNCGCCPQWYKSYIQACKDKGIEATLMKSGKFCSFDVTPTQGKDMTKKEAAKELGVSKATVDTYLSAGKLKGDGNGGVDDESVEVYKRKREENFKKMECAKRKVQCEVEKTTQQAIEEMEMQDDEDVIVFKVKELQEIVAKKVKDAYLKGIEAGKARLRAKRVQPDHLEKMVDIWAECAMQE